jgi:hypothetical protein
MTHFACARFTLLLTLFVVGASAQIEIDDPATGTAINQKIVMSSTVLGDFDTKQLTVKNIGSKPFLVDPLQTIGLGFSVCCDGAFTLNPGESHNLSVTFAPPDVRDYTGSLQVGALTLLLFGSGLPGPTLYVSTPSGMQQASASQPLSFSLDPDFSGSLSCQLRNTATKAMATVNALRTEGPWRIASLPALPIAIAPGQRVSFQLMRSDVSSDLTGSVFIDARRYRLAPHPPLPNMSLAVDHSPLLSGQQARLTVSFDSTPPIEISGTVEISLTAVTSITVTDPAILFPATGTTHAQFRSVAGKTTADFDGQPFLAFQTGTTAGVLHLHAVWSDQDVDLKAGITPAPIAIDSVSARRDGSNLVVTISGYDNTRTAGRFNFSFFDKKSAFIGNPIRSDVTQAFSQFFFEQETRAGGMFAVSARFPVSGDSGQVDAVQVDCINASGDAQSSVTRFQ